MKKETNLFALLCFFITVIGYYYNPNDFQLFLVIVALIFFPIILYNLVFETIFEGK